jgi:DNA-binding NtrC family response regulator
MQTGTLLFVAESSALTGLFAKAKELGLELGLAENLSGALSFIEKSRPLMVFSRTRLPGYRIESLLGKAAEAPIGEFPPVVAVAEQGAVEEAKKLMELGAHDYWVGSFDWSKIATALPQEAPPEPAGPETPEPPPAAAPQPPTETKIIGEHSSMQRILGLARQVAPSKATVLISGESGTGKEKIARFLHTHSGRDGKPFIAVNCAALPEHLLESELFGHEKGAFTGAISRKLGKFELASGGTILLDEISEMDLGLQAKLLRVLQESEIDRVGGMETVRVDVRVLATTNRFLEDYVSEGKFRQDLYYRLNVIPLKLPPLRDRGDDVMLLARFFMNNFCKQYGLPELGFSPEAEQWLKEYDWPGNVRELQNLMERAVLLAGTGPIQKMHFLLDGEDWPGPEFTPAEAASAPPPQEGPGQAAPEAAPAASAPQPGHDEFEMPLAEIEKHHILRRLSRTQGNRTQAAETLGISVRTLRNKLNEYRKQGVDIP